MNKQLISTLLLTAWTLEIESKYSNDLIEQQAATMLRRAAERYVKRIGFDLELFKQQQEFERFNAVK